MEDFRTRRIRPAGESGESGLGLDDHSGLGADSGLGGAARLTTTQVTPPARPSALGAEDGLRFLFDTDPDVLLGDSDATDTRRALREARLGRFNLLCVAMACTALVAVAFGMSVPVAPETRRLAVGSTALLFADFLWLRLSLRRLSPMVRPTMIAFVVVVTWGAALTAHYAFGVFSSYTAAVCMGMLLFSSAVARWPARLAFGILVIGYMVIGLIPVYAPEHYSPMIRIVLRGGEPAWYTGMATVLFLYASSFAAGRWLRAHNAEVVLKMDAAVRLASRRRAALIEAREALERVAGIGEPGRFTGQNLDGFELGVVIGRGGMGEVYEATSADHDTPLAVKVMRRELFEGQDLLKRFVHEASIAATIDSPNVVRVIAVGGMEATIPYIAMERLKGHDLAEQLRDRGRPSPEEIEGMLRGVAEGLAMAHRNDVVHRDLKPQNIYYAKDSDGRGCWKVLDFGVSKQLNIEAPQTMHHVVGTPHYMSPEQARGDAVDGRADIYSLGVVVYRCLTGELPYRENDPSRLVHLLQNQRPRNPRAFARIHPQLEGVLAMALARDPADRFDDARDFARAYSEGRRGELGPELAVRAQAALAREPWQKR